jgi:hypothetical protein
MSDEATITVPPQAATAREVLEAWGDWIDIRELRRQDPDEPFRGSAFVPDRRENRARGEDYPTFRTENDLAEIRAIGDFFAKGSSGGVGALSTLANYVFSKGFTFTAQPAENVGAVSEELVAAVQREINAFLEENSFAGRIDRELDNRARRHGDALLHIKPRTDGSIRASFAEPSQLTEPPAARRIEDWLTGAGIVDCSGFSSSWSFGVHTPEGRHEESLGYHFLWNTTGTDWDYVPADRVLHVKRNVDACVKRGVSDFHACQEFLLQSEKLLRNTAVGSAIQAAIAYIRQHVAGTNKDAVEQQRADKATRVTSQPTASGGTRQVYNRRFDPGTVLDVNKGMEYMPGPLGSERAPRFIEVVQAALRYVGVRWSMPEYMISGDASNANLASALVAEAPFVKAREADQLTYSLHFRELIWKVLRIAHDMGRFTSHVGSFRDLQAAIYLKIDPPAVATRDRQKEITADKLLVDAGAMAVATMAQRDGLDHKAEVDAGAKPAMPFMSPMLATTPQANGGELPPAPTGTRPTTESVDDAVRRTCTTFHNYP